ncbi:hypothetical protein ACB092_06G126100 [Castanea dentata]
MILVFLSETKASESKMKEFQQKLKLTQGIMVPSEGKSGGLAMIWKEGTDVRLKSCSNSHIDVVVHSGSSVSSWRATGFYGQPNTSKRHISWKLLNSLRKQCEMPWVVFGDFNEITQSEEKVGWMERDARQMREFRECLNNCDLTSLGFVGQRYTWCNGHLGEQRTLIRLDRMVANEEWRGLFPEAKVYHVAMFASDHCLLVLCLQRKVFSRLTKRRFLFEAMWS